MKLIKMNIKDINKPDKNVRIHTDTQLKEFERSIKMFGQIRPIIVDENNTILAGVGCYETLCRLGIENADVYKLENLTANQKKKLMIADNKVFNLGIDDLETFNSFLEELNGDLDIPGFDEDLLQSMVAEAEDISVKISEYGTIDDEDIASINSAKERLEAKIEKAEAEDNQVQEPTPSNPESKEQATEMSIPVRKSIICPKCGEEIWL